MNVTNIREKHPSTQRAYMGLKVASRLHADVAADVIAAPPAGYCINIWGVFFLTNAGTIEAIGIGDGVITPISVGLGVDTIDTHSADGSEIKLVSIYYTIVPV